MWISSTCQIEKWCYCRQSIRFCGCQPLQYCFRCNISGFHRARGSCQEHRKCMSYPELPYHYGQWPSSYRCHCYPLVPMVDAEEIRSGWLRPYLSSSTGQEPKQLSAHTIQYLTCVLKSYLRDLLNSSAPPFVHLMQQVRTYPPLFTYCFTLVRAWLVLVAFSELNSRKRKYRTRIQDTMTQLC